MRVKKHKIATEPVKATKRDRPASTTTNKPLRSKTSSQKATPIKTPQASITVDKPVEKRRTLDIVQCAKLRLKNKLTYQEIASLYDVSPQAVEQGISRLFGMAVNPEHIQSFEDHKSILLTAVEQKLLASLVEEKRMKKASLNNVAYALQNVSNINRLEQGKSTANLSLQGAVQASIHALSGLDQLFQELSGTTKVSNSLPDTNDKPDNTGT